MCAGKGLEGPCAGCEPVWHACGFKCSGAVHSIEFPFMGTDEFEELPGPAAMPRLALHALWARSRRTHVAGLSVDRRHSWPWAGSRRGAWRAAGRLAAGYMHPLHMNGLVTYSIGLYAVCVQHATASAAEGLRC